MVSIKPDKELIQGDSCNTLSISLSNHSGTHVDCPAHFCKNGKNLNGYLDTFWRCLNIQVLNCDLKDEELCGPAHFQRAWEISDKKNDHAEMVILNTGWYRKRNQERYWKTPPGILPGVAEWLRKRFPGVRFFGFDLISISSFVHRSIGREAHKAFLCGKQPILLVEDMDLTRLKNQNLDTILISPIFIDEADAAPCTVWANF